MDKTWQKNLLAFLGLATAILSVVAYFWPRSEPATAATIDIEARLGSERQAIMQFVIAKTANAEGKLDGLQNSIQDFKTEMRENFKKLDDRLYEIQRDKVTRLYDENSGS